MAKYIELDIETDPEDVTNDAYSFMKALFPGWDPAAGNLDVAIIQAMSAIASQARDIAARMPTAAFRWFGANLIGIQPIDATPAICTTTWTMKDNAGYTIPAGTQVGLISGGETIPFETVNTVVVPPGSTATSAGAITIVAINPGADGSGLGSPGGTVTLLDPLDYVSTVVQVAATTGGVDAESDDDYLDRLTSQLQLLAPRPILAKDFVVFARAIAGVWRATALDGYNPYHNLLTANQADAETDATGWANDSNATVASTGAQAANGAKSVSLTAIAAADMSAFTPGIVPPAGGSIACNPGETVTGVVSIRANTTVRSCKAYLRFYTAAGALIGTITAGAAANDSNAAWTVYTVTATAPATAAFVRVGAFVTAPALGEVHYADKASIRRGSTTTDWVQGGTAETGQERMITIAAIDVNGNAVSAPILAAIQADLDARREINFVINTISPTYAQVAVTYQVRARPGYDLPTLVSTINAALASYLNPGNWGIPPIGDPRDWESSQYVRYLEIAQVINDTEGVDYITTTAGNYDLTIGFQGGTMARTDLLLPGPIGLPTAGTMTGTAL